MTEWMDSCVWNVSLSSIYLSRRMRGYWHVHQVLWMMQTKENRIDNNADDPTGMRPDMHYCLFAWLHGKKRNCGHCCAQYKGPAVPCFPFDRRQVGTFPWLLHCLVYPEWYDILLCLSCQFSCSTSTQYKFNSYPLQWYLFLLWLTHPQYMLKVTLTLIN